MSRMQPARYSILHTHSTTPRKKNFDKKRNASLIVDGIELDPDCLAKNLVIGTKNADTIPSNVNGQGNVNNSDDLIFGLGGTGADTYNGGSGNDLILEGDEVGTTVEGGGQTDTIQLQGDITVGNFDPNGVERIFTQGFVINGEGGNGSTRTIDLRGLTSSTAAATRSRRA